MDVHSGPKAIRVLVADRSAKTGRVVAQIFNTATGFTCVGVATTPADFAEDHSTPTADVLLLDPGPEGADWIAPLETLQSNGTVRGVVIFSLYRRFMEDRIIKRADAFLRKDCGSEELLMTVRAVAELTHPGGDSPEHRH